MPSAFSGIYMASNALRSFEIALNVTGHNLANINTRGYSRQTLEMQQTPEQTFYGLRPFKIGTGAFVQSVTRIKDAFLQGRFMQTYGEGARLGQMMSSLRGVETIFAEGGSDSISNAMNAMFNAFSQLSANPADDAARLNVRMHADAFANRIRGTHNQMMMMRAEAGQQTVGTIQEINRLAEGIAQLNQEVRLALASGGVPNDLLDRRDLAIEDLSKLVNTRTQTLNDGSVIVFVDQHTLVNQTHAMPLPTAYDPATSSLTDGLNTIRITSGRLAGLLGGINAIDTYRAQIETLVNEIRDNLNTIHAAGFGLNGATGIDFFTGTGIADFQLNTLITDDLRNIAASATGAPGDGSVAAALAAIRETQLTALGDRSPVAFYESLVGRIAQDAFFFAGALETQHAVLEQLENQRQAVSGVNVDEELANMLRFQRSFQAAAKILSVLDQTTEELIRAFGR